MAGYFVWSCNVKKKISNDIWTSISTIPLPVNHLLSLRCRCRVVCCELCRWYFAIWSMKLCIPMMARAVHFTLHYDFTGHAEAREDTNSVDGWWLFELSWKHYNPVLGGYETALTCIFRSKPPQKLPTHLPPVTPTSVGVSSKLATKSFGLTYSAAAIRQLLECIRRSKIRRSKY
jgi:hypothetical protein